MKNVLIDMHRLKANPFNGLYRFSIELGKELARLSTDPLQLHFYVPEKDFGVFGNEVAYERHKSIDKFFKPGTSRFDVWHATTTLSWYKPFNRKTKFVFTIHDLNFLDEEERSNKHKSKYLRLIQQRVNRADYLTFISEYSKAEAAKHLNLGSKPCSVIYNGCNAPAINTFKAPDVAPQKPFLFSIGLFMSRKNFHVLPALLEGNEYELVIAGLNDMPYKEAIIEAAKEHGVLDRLRLTGPISEEEKFWYYKNCEAFLFPSIGEGFGLPAIEAMWFGKPVFLANTGCMPEIGGEAAYYFDSFEPDAMRTRFAQGLRHYTTTSAAERIKQRAAFFSWEKAAASYVEVYNQLI